MAPRDLYSGILTTQPITEAVTRKGTASVKAYVGDDRTIITASSRLARVDELCHFINPISLLQAENFFLEGWANAKAADKKLSKFILLYQECP